MNAEASEHILRRLHRERPRDRFLRCSGLFVLLLVVVVWVTGDFGAGALLTPRRFENLSRFLQEAKPRLSGVGDAAPSVLSWASELWREKAREATWTTLGVSVAAIGLAGVAALVLSLPAARSWTAPDHLGPSASGASGLERWWWRAVLHATRTGLVVARSVPEYILAFLFVAALGPSLWPLVLALAIHNAAILGKLTGEAIEDSDPRPVSGLRHIGATRLQLAVVTVFPAVLPRFLLYLFYRWETCVREATVLGMLGVSSLGYWIVDARARNHYDEMLFFVLLAAGLVLVGDLVSAVVRSLVRNA